MTPTLAPALSALRLCSAREFGTQILSVLLLVGSALSFSCCNGLFEGIYDTPPKEGEKPQRGFLSYDATTHRGKIFAEVSSYQHVTFPSTYRTDSVIHTDPMPMPKDWSFAFHHYNVATHNGTVLATPYHSLDALPQQGAEKDALLAQTFTPDEWTTHQAHYDLSGIFLHYIGYQHAAFNPVLSTWMDMDVKNPPPRYTLSGLVYLLRLQDGTVAAMHLPSHLNAAGQKGYVTIDYIWPY